MHNWSTDTTQLKKNRHKYTVWKLEQMINFGLDGEKINKKAVKKYWSELQLDPSRKKFLSLLLWPRKQS